MTGSGDVVHTGGLANPSPSSSARRSRRAGRWCGARRATAGRRPGSPPGCAGSWRPTGGGGRCGGRSAGADGVLLAARDEGAVEHHARPGVSGAAAVRRARGRRRSSSCRRPRAAAPAARARRRRCSGAPSRPPPRPSRARSAGRRSPRRAASVGRGRARRFGSPRSVTERHRSRPRTARLPARRCGDDRGHHDAHRPAPPVPDPDALVEAFTDWAFEERGLSLYPAQEEALLELVTGGNVILSTPTGSGKSLVAVGAHAAALARGERTFYTAPIKALVSEKFFAAHRRVRRRQGRDAHRRRRGEREGADHLLHRGDPRQHRAALGARRRRRLRGDGRVPLLRRPGPRLGVAGAADRAAAGAVPADERHARRRRRSSATTSPAAPAATPP